MDTKDYKNEFLIQFADCYHSLNWERENQEIKSEFGNYTVRIDCTKEGEFLQVMPKGEYLGKTIDAKNYPLVSQIRKDVWEMINKKSEDSFWQKVIMNLPNGCI